MRQRGCTVATPSPVYLFKHVKHGTQNIRNDCSQLLFDSFRVYTKFVFGRGAVPNFAGDLTVPQIPYSWLKGPTSQGRGGESESKGRERGEEGKGGTAPFTLIPRSAPLLINQPCAVCKRRGRNERYNVHNIHMILHMD